jgi:hypothetical protein
VGTNTNTRQGLISTTCDGGRHSRCACSTNRSPGGRIATSNVADQEVGGPGTAVLAVSLGGPLPDEFRQRRRGRRRGVQQHFSNGARSPFV